MSRDKTIAVVGLSDEDTAHLRLLMRRCAAELDCPWRWGGESGADLIVVDLGTFGGQMARTRAQAAGVRCAIYSADPLDTTDLVLRRPLLVDNVTKVLNEAARANPGAEQIGPNNAEFYTRDVGEASLGSATVALRPSAADADGVRAEPPARGLDELLRGDPVELRAAPAKPPQPPPSLTDAVVASALPTAPPKKYATRAAMLEDTAPRQLREFLDEDLLRGPAMVTIGEAPTLVLDPKLKVFHSIGGLGALEPYCHASWRLCDFTMLTTAELNALRAAQPAQPYSRLLWLHVLIHSQGRLASHLDPGGTYRLKRWIEIERDLSRYFRIASVMLQPARLHEIAAASGAAMGDVFDLVNAYDAIGLIEWQARARREAAGSASLLDRLRNPFGRS